MNSAPSLKMLNPALQFQDRIKSLLAEPGVREKVLKLMSEHNLPQSPVLVLTIKSPTGQAYTLQNKDLQEVFSIYGTLSSTTVQDNEAYIIFDDIVSAYFAQKTLNGRELHDSNLVLNVMWKSTEPTDAQNTWSPYTFYTDFSYKYTCRFEIQIPNEKHFQVARRLIGTKGKNMKRIVELCSSGLDCQPHDIIKLRLRGKGSGFREGPCQEESDEPLHMCVSSKFYDRYVLACEEIEKLLAAVYQEFQYYRTGKGVFSEGLKVRKLENINRALQDSTNYLYY